MDISVGNPAKFLPYDGAGSPYGRGEFGGNRRRIEVTSFLSRDGVLSIDFFRVPKARKVNLEQKNR